MQINYAYNSSGTRSLKIVGDTTEAYVRDASGNIMSVYKKIGSGVLKQTELTMYGSSIIGNVSEQTTTSETVTLQGGFTSGITKIFTRGEKEYLLTDHRSNNMVSITDRRQQYSTSGTTIDYYIADIKTANYYSAFGAISNSYNSDLIKYGFNGQRRSTEISGTAQTAEFWEYNGDVGRRWNVDPRPTVGMSAYGAFFNNPIIFRDIHGDTPIIKINSIDYSKDSKQVNANLSISGTIKVLNVSTEPSVNSYVKELVNQKQLNFRGSGQAQSYQKYKHDGKIFPTNSDGAVPLVTFSGDVDISMNFVEIHSLNQLEPGDQVLFFVDNLEVKGVKNPVGLAPSAYIMLVDAKASHKTRVTFHEVFHTFGLGDEYIKNPDGSTQTRDKTSENLMDLGTGFRLTKEQVGLMIGNFIDDRGRRKKESQPDTKVNARKAVQKYSDIDINNLSRISE